MKKILIILLIILTSCSINEYEKQLIGHWNNYPNGGMSDMKFYQDSVITNEYHIERKGTWRATETEIKFHFPKKIKGYREFYTLDYKISNDSLLIKNKSEQYQIPSLYRVTNYWTHFLREVGLKIDLPKADFPLIENKKSMLGLNIYVGLENTKLKILSNFREIRNENDFLSLIFSERAIRKESEEDLINFNLIVDKNVNEKTIDSLKIKLKTISDFKIFRVYKKDSANYGMYDIKNTGEPWNWYGKYE